MVITVWYAVSFIGDHDGFGASIVTFFGAGGGGAGAGGGGASTGFVTFSIRVGGGLGTGADCCGGAAIFVVVGAGMDTEGRVRTAEPAACTFGGGAAAGAACIIAGGAGAACG